MSRSPCGNVPSLRVNHFTPGPVLLLESSIQVPSLRRQITPKPKSPQSTIVSRRGNSVLTAAAPEAVNNGRTPEPNLNYFLLSPLGEPASGPSRHGRRFLRQPKKTTRKPKLSKSIHHKRNAHPASERRHRQPETEPEDISKYPIFTENV